MPGSWGGGNENCLIRVQSVSLGWLTSSGGDNCDGWAIMWMHLMLLKYILKMVKVENLFFCMF